MKFATCLMMVAGLSSIAACGELDENGNPIAGEIGGATPGEVTPGAAAPDGGAPADDAVETKTGALSIGNMNAGEYLFAGQRLVASQCYFSLRMQGDGNLVVYAGPTAANPIWATHTDYWPNSYTALQKDGNLVVYNPNGYSQWASHTEKHANVRLAMQNDGNLVLYRGTDALWSTHTARAAQSWPCANVPQSESTFVEPGFNRPGKDYRSFYTTGGVPTCGQACAQDAKCAAFTYVPAGIQDPSRAVCWLKDSVPAVIPDSNGMVSGYKKFAPSTN